MSNLSKETVVDMMNAILLKKGLQAIESTSVSLRDIGFRSLDFSELALRVERKLGRELNFDAGLMRNIQTVDDVLNFFVQAGQSKE
jgi:acyl carrier protein